MKKHEPKPLDYAPPRKERTRLWDMPLADWILAFILAALLMFVVGTIVSS